MRHVLEHVVEAHGDQMMMMAASLNEPHCIHARFVSVNYIKRGFVQFV